ncbi:amidase [Bordetella tumulicola]|uniref:amidase n=1 Tax=Bordetella tumulicola TaxID=1649133 RepID=UPI0039EDF634
MSLNSLPSTDLAALSIAEASRGIASGDWRPTDLLQAIFDRLDAVDGVIHSYLRTDREAALAAAGQADLRAEQGTRLGALDGIPFAVKDNIYTSGLATTGGSRVPQHHDPALHATLVARLQAAGAILVGKLNTWEYGTGTGAVHFDLDAPPAHNPWHPDHFTGGSSSGSGAAVAAGTAYFAIGTDTGGSVRLPAAACGVVGLKPTFGRVSRHGIMPNCPSFDIAGPLTVTVEDACLVYEAIAGHDPADPTTLNHSVEPVLPTLRDGVKGLRVGLVRRLDPVDDVEPAIAQALDQACEALRAQGAHVAEISLPIAAAEYRSVAAPINRSESYAANERDYLEHRDLMGRALREKLDVGKDMRASIYLGALRQRQDLIARTDAVFADVDVLLLPMTDRVAPLLSDEQSVIAFTTRSAGSPFSLTGHPAVSVPAGFNDKGLPVAVQLVAGFLQEARLMRCARVLECHFTPEPLRAKVLPGAARQP